MQQKVLFLALLTISGALFGMECQDDDSEMQEINLNADALEMEVKSANVIIVEKPQGNVQHVPPVVARQMQYQYRTQHNLNANKCTKPIKQLIDGCFCENRNSCCIRNNVDPIVCHSNCALCCTAGLMTASAAKLLAVAVFHDPQNATQLLFSIRM